MSVNKATNLSGHKVLKKITTLGYEDPSKDHDKRQVRIWTYITTLLELGYTLEILEEYDFKDFAPKSHKGYRFFQNRTEGEGDIAGVEDYFNEFYIGNEDLERIPFCIKHDGLVFALSGNKRMRAHEMGVNQGYNSRCDIVLLLPPADVEDFVVYEVGYEIAKFSNLRSNTTRETHGSDHAGMCQSKFDIMLMQDPDTYGNWTEEEKVSWAKKYLVDEIDSSYGYDTVGKKSALTRVANEAFSSGIAPPLDMPEGESLSDTFTSFWPKAIWDESNEKVICLSNSDGIWVNLEQKLTNRWLNRPEFTPVRKKMFLVTKVGKRDMTSISSVKSERGKMLVKLKEWNTNVNVIGGGACLISKVLFTAQLSHEEDGHIAYEWNEQTDDFDVVEKK